MTGLLWLSSVPPTSGLVAVMFGTRWLAMLVGIAFLSHQVGGSLGVYLGGLLYERPAPTTSIWWVGVLFGVLSALINLPIVEKPVARPACNRPALDRWPVRASTSLQPTGGVDVDGRVEPGMTNEPWRHSKRS